MTATLTELWEGRWHLLLALSLTHLLVGCAAPIPEAPSSTAPSTWSVTAWGETFEVFPYNPILDRIFPNTFVNHASELAPAVFALPDRYLLFYAAADRDLGEWENLRVAVNPPPVPE